MNERARRKELLAQYRQTRPEAGVYRIINIRNGKALLGSSTNLASERSKLQFAKSSRNPGVLEWRLLKDIGQFGLDAFSFEVLEVLEMKSETTTAEIRRDLATLESPWRERFDPALLH